MTFDLWLTPINKYLGEFDSREEGLLLVRAMIAKHGDRIADDLLLISDDDDDEGLSGEELRAYTAALDVGAEREPIHPELESGSTSYDGRSDVPMKMSAKSGTL